MCVELYFFKGQKSTIIGFATCKGVFCTFLRAKRVRFYALRVASYKGVYGTIFEGEKIRFEVLLLAVILMNYMI